MTRYSKSVLATGHELVSRAAADILLMGGNAFDAVVAAGFAGAVAEQTLTSLGGVVFFWHEQQGIPVRLKRYFSIFLLIPRAAVFTGKWTLIFFL